MAEVNVDEVIKNVCVKFSVESLKTEQYHMLQSMLAKKDCIAVLPTGFGKSLPYQIYLPVVRELGRLGPQTERIIVCCPLVALMKDQVERLHSISELRVAYKEATKALHNVSGGSRGKESETEWAARLAVHFFSPLSLVQDYLLDSCSNHKVLECPCSCKSRIKYGDTSIGHPKTWFGLFDIVIGKALSPLETEVHIAATVIPEEPVEESESILESSEDNLSQNEVKFKSLEQFFPQIASQSIVFSFYQKKCNSAISIVPYIAVSKTHVQFHFYDCEKDLYFLSQEMPLFSHDDTELFLETVIATWLVLNYRYLLSGPTKGMVKGEKFGFHSNVSDEVLNLYRNEIKMGITELKTENLDIWNGYFDQGVTFDASDTLKRKKNMKMQQS